MFYLNGKKKTMKKILFTFATILVLASSSFAQVLQTVEKPKEVSQQSTEWRWSTTGASVKYLADGKNDNRAAINIGEGIPVSRLVSSLPPSLGAFRVVPMVTLSGSEAGAAPRSTLALLAPSFEVFGGLTVQPGVAAKGLALDKSFDAVNGLQGYISVSVNFDKFTKSLGLKRVLGL